jgi:HPt (histidine-containing phosphotransfer) domain-containing protein
MDDFLPKPFTARQLQRLLDRWVEGEHAGDRPAETEAERTPGPEAAAHAQGEAVDREVLDELSRFVSPDFLIQTIDAFLVLCESTLRELRAAQAAGDTAEVSRLAHRLRGSAGTTGALRFGEMCGVLEQAAESGVPLLPLLQDLALEFERVRALLAVERDRAEWQR